jgi:tRNA-dihydrouridine synthase C
MGCDGVDLNFGCPAKQVNRHGGGAALLQDPEVLYRITRAVRSAVPSHQTVSAKMRLGFDHDQQAEECALALEAGGVSEIVIHARTKADGYRPPAYWPRISDIRARVKVPLIANGEIWNVQDALRARQDSGCHDVMIGRGMVTNPGLGLALKDFDGRVKAKVHCSEQLFAPLTWQEMLPHLMYFWELVQARISRKHQAGRFKQWLNFLRKHFVEAEVAYLTLRTMSDPQVISDWLLLQSGRVSAQQPVAPHAPTAPYDVAPHHEKSALQIRDQSSSVSLAHSNH